MHRKFWILLCILAFEKAAAARFGHPWANSYLGKGIPLVFGMALLFFGRAPLRRCWYGDSPFDWRFAAIHTALLVCLALLDIFLRDYQWGVSGAAHAVAVCIWVALVPALVFSLLRAFLPFRKLLSLGRALVPAVLYSAAVSVLVIVVREGLRFSWNDSSSRLGQMLQGAAFSEAGALLTLFYPVVVSYPALNLLGTDRFVVEIAGECSGVEGLALVSVFMLVWFVVARSELRIRRALLLVPLALSLVWLFNLVRIVALIAIGDAGYPDAAFNGFHSVAGWVAFNVVSLGFLLVAQRVTWFRRAPTSVPLDVEPGRFLGPAVSRNIPAIYLSPFVAITAASLISQAGSGGFERLYALRFGAALVLFYVFRNEYRKIDWRFGVLGPVVGLAVAAMWIGLHAVTARWSLPGLGGDTIKESLEAWSPGERIVWIFFRILAAVVTVPIAEELAFRGFLARRIMDADVETVPYSRLSTLSIAISSVAFGLMHGRMWAPGILAGVAFALVARVRGRLGESVAAHASANLTISVLVLLRGDYTLW